MNDQTDQQLLRAYAASHSEPAFTELVHRHINLVYSAAFRMVGDAHLAQDVTQAAFAALAQHAAQLADCTVVSGWLHRTTRNLASKAIRTEVRRRAREQESAAMNQLLDPSAAASWEQIAPHLDAALDDLCESDRDAVLLRYFERKSANQMAVHLGLSPEAAQKRLNRAVDRLREFLAKRGVSIGAGGLTVIISANAVQAAPVGLLATVSAAALAGTAATTSTIIAGTAKIITMTALQKTLLAASVVLAATAIYQSHQNARLREQLQQGQEQITQIARERDEALSRLARVSARATLQLPAPALSSATVAAPLEDPPATNMIAALLQGAEVRRLTPEQAARYADENHRNAESLLAAYRTSGDVALLREAMAKYRENPQVAFEAILSKDTQPQERLQWAEAFKQSAPENSLANYLAAAEHLNAGQTDQAVQELIAASDKSEFLDYTLDRVQADEEAYRSAGYSDVDTSMASTWGLLLPQLKELKQLSSAMIDLSTPYQSAGDSASAQTALEMAIQLGGRFDGSSGTTGLPLVTQLVGVAIQQKALKAMDHNRPYGDTTVGERLDELAQFRKQVSDLVKQTEPLQAHMTPQDWINYNTRTRMFGEANAIQWLINKYSNE